MALAKGSLSKLSFTQETSYGVTPVGIVFSKIPFGSEGLDDSIDRLQSEDIRSDRMQPPMRAGNHGPGGQISQDLCLEQMSPFWRHLLSSLATTPAPTTVTPIVLTIGTVNRGTYYSTGGGVIWWLCVKGGSVTTNILTAPTSGRLIEQDGCVFLYMGAPNSRLIRQYVYDASAYSGLPSVGLAIEKQILGGNENSYALFRGCRVNSLDLAINQRGNVKATWGILAKDMKEQTTAFSTGTTSYSGFSLGVYSGDGTVAAGDEMFVGKDCALLVGGIGTGSQEIRPYRDLSLSITNACDAGVYVISEDVRHDIPEGSRLVQGRLSTYFKDRKEYLAFKNEVTAAMTYTLIHPYGGMIKIDLPEVKFSGGGLPKIGGQGTIMADFDFMSFVEQGTTDIKVTFYSPEIP